LADCIQAFQDEDGNEKEFDMPKKLTWLVLLSTAIVAISGSALATPPEGFTSTTIAQGRFGAFDVSNYFVSNKGKLWFSSQKTKGLSDGYFLTNTWLPGGSTGWHTHPGSTLIIVTAGTVTHYDGDDPSCKAHVYTTGMTFVDRGGTHVHNVRNEGDIEAQVIAFRLIPAGQPGRIDAPDPGNCPF
jgi:quercetin dioxygenase-like cupin family protein